MYRHGLFAFISIVIAVFSVHADDDQRFDLSRAWFKPELLVNNKPEVCEPLFRSYFDYFASPDASNPLQPISSRGSGDNDPGELPELISELDWTELGGTRIGDETLRLAKWRQGNQYFGIVEQGEAIGWRPHTYQYFLVDEPPPDAAATDANGGFGEGSLALLDESAEPGVYEVIYPPDPRYNYRELTGVEVANVYIVGKDVYLALVGHTGGELRQPVYFVTSVASPHQLRLVCQFTTSPPSTAVRSEAAKIPFFSDFEQVTSSIMGGGGNCGTLNAPARAMNDLREGLDALVVRPWTYPTNQGGYDFTAWGYSGAWNYRKVLELRTVLPKSRQALADRYAQHYRLAAGEALKLADAAIAAAFERGFGHGQTEIAHEGRVRALLEGEPVEVVEPHLPDLALEKDQYSDSLLAFAIGHPHLVDLLLKHGYDPNKSNAFGKTALMYAAQFNDLESAKLLIKYGANIESATTRPFDTCGYTIRTHYVTALHYAVRYASADFITWLVESGAVTSAKDTNGRTALDYMTKFGGYVRYGVEATSSYGQQNRLLTQVQIDSLAAQLLPLDEGKRRQLADESNRRAEASYRAGNLDEAYAAVKRSLALDPKHESAWSNMSLISLKLGYHGESAKAASQLIRTASTEGLRASAYFNLGLACEAAGSKGFHYTSIMYDGARYCEERWDRYQGPLHNYLMAYQTVPTASRANAIAEFLERIDGQNQKWLCRADDGAAGPRSVYVTKNHIYFLGKTGDEVAYPKVARRERGQDVDLQVKGKERFHLGNGLSVSRWESHVPFQGTLVLGSQLCSRFLPALIDDGTELIELYTSGPGKSVSVSSRTSKPILLVLYGNQATWNISDDSVNIRAIYVHGRDSEVRRSNKSAVVTYMDTRTDAYAEPWGSSFNAYTSTRIGLSVDAMVTATTQQPVQLDDTILANLPPCDRRPRFSCRLH